VFWEITSLPGVNKSTSTDPLHLPSNETDTKCNSSFGGKTQKDPMYLKFSIFGPSQIDREAKMRSETVHYMISNQMGEVSQRRANMYRDI